MTSKFHRDCLSFKMPTDIRLNCNSHKMYQYLCDTVTVWFRLQSGQHSVASWYCWKCVLWVLLLHFWCFKHHHALSLFHVRSRPCNHVFGAAFELFLSQGSSSANSPNCVTVSPVPNHAKCTKVLGFAVTSATATHAWGSRHSESACSAPHGMAVLQLQPLGKCSRQPLGNTWKQVPWMCKSLSPVIGNEEKCQHCITVQVSVHYHKLLQI